MKIKNGVFKKLTGEPNLVQDLGDKKLAIYWMDDTPYYKQYTSQGRFSLWTSNGKEYKLLITKEYYETISEIYSPKTSLLWVNYLELMGKIQFKFNLIFYSIALVIIAVVVTLAIVLQQQMIALIGLIVVLIISMVQNGVLRKKVQGEGDKLQYSLMTEIGEENFKNVINRQQAYFANFFQKEENTHEEPMSEEQNVIENIDEPVSDEKIDYKEDEDIKHE